MFIKDYRSYWSENKPKAKNYLRIDDYEDFLETVVKSTFDYEGYPTDELPEMIEETNLRFGKGIIWECDGEYIATEVSFTGEMTPFGFLKDARGTAPNGKVKDFPDWMNNPDCVVFFNNNTWSPDMNIGRFADYLSNVDISEEMLVLYSRMKPLFVAKDENTKKALDKIIKDLQEGKISTVVTDGMASIVKDSGEKTLDTLTLTDVTAVQWLQYLSSYHNDVLSRFYFINGMDTHQSSKMAQQSVEEVTSGSEARFIIPMNKFKYRQKMNDECRTKFGWDCEVRFSHCWEHLHQEVTGDPELEDESIEDQVEEPRVDETAKEGE